MKKQLYILLIFSLFFKLSALSQEGSRYVQFDRKKFHFGFALGVNTADFNYAINLDSTNTDSIFNISVNSQPGFNLGIVSSWNINEYFHVRFIPSLSFQEREFVYDYTENGMAAKRVSRLESTTLDFPVMLKLRTKRINNWAAYFLTGLQYSLDLASQSKTAIDFHNPIAKTKQHDFSYQFGGGFDFFQEYFKLGLELKISNGLKDINIHDDTFYTKPLTYLNSKVWWFSITFEG
jgi:hypothetical protein